MSLVESFLEGKEMRKAGKSTAQIERESKQDMRNLQRDQFNYKKKNDERQRKFNQGKNVFEYQILPVVESMQKNNATPEQYAVFNDKVKYEYGEVLTPIFGKKPNGEVNFDIGYSPMKKQATGSSMMMLTKESLEKYAPPDSPLHSIMLEKIERNGGKGLFKVEYTEDGRLDLSSIGVNEYADIFEKMGISVADEKDFNKNKEMVDALLGIKKKVDLNKGDGNDKNGGEKKGDGNWLSRFLYGDQTPVSNETKVTTKSAESENLPKFNTEDEALNANLPTGTKVIINGRRAVI